MIAPLLRFMTWGTINSDCFNIETDSENDEIDELRDNTNHQNSEVDSENEEFDDIVGIDSLENDDLKESMNFENEFYGSCI
ncbi:unnamed protein product [Brachionus calyciflorus]|uniref:Uncharacterized protein n=1 Tax=Brachionus calyciflorus TaxID=104777 RepID=A0A813RYA2_9BILA|nr:unnamed protein product [Brachionus calyciflorus]